MFRMEDGKVIGRLREGVRPSFPAVGGQDFRFFVEPLSPVPAGFEESRRLGFTGFMSRVGYECARFSSEKEAWQALSAEWSGQLILFTPALRNNKYYVIDDAQREPIPSALDETEELLPVPVFSAEEDASFDGDVNKFCQYLAEGKPLPGLSKKYWDKEMRPSVLAAAFRHPDAPKKKMYALFAMLHEDTFRKVELTEGGAYFGVTDRAELGYSVVDMGSPDIAPRCVLCRTAPLIFLPKSLIPFLRKDMKPVPENFRIVQETAKRGGFPILRGRKPLEMPAEAAKEANAPEPQAEIAEKSEIETPKETAEKKEISIRAPVSARPEGKPAAERSVRERPALTEREFLFRFYAAARRKGLLYDNRDLLNFHVSVKSSRLVILAGMSGTGKSGLVRLYADALGLPKEQLAVLPVRPSWMDDSDLLGYADLKNMVYRPADTGLSEILIEAEKHPEKLYIVCFDEMNLARAEHYFAQFISALEREENPVIRLYNPTLAPRLYNSAAYPPEITVGRNVIFTGTINVDESTYHFSDKILDRANVLTLRRGKFKELLKLPRPEPVSYSEVSAELFAGFRRRSSGIGLTETELDLLDTLNETFCAGGLSGIGYRALRQMGQYLVNLPSGMDMTRGDGLDCQLVQRVFTKLRGGSEQLKALVAEDDKGLLTGSAAAVLDRFGNLSAFTEARRCLAKKARELKLYDYTM